MILNRNKKEYIKNGAFRQSSRQAGFTLLETLVAIFILSLSITGPMFFASNSLKNAFQSRDQVTAFFLAQDVVEYIKNIRDTNGLKPGEVNWLEGLGNCVSTDGSRKCTIDTIPGRESIDLCVGETCSPLGIINDNGSELYGNGGSDSRFTRTIFINEIIPGQEAQIIVEVVWTSNILNSRKRIVIQENIYDWIPSGSI